MVLASCHTKGSDSILSKGRYDETFAGEDVVLGNLRISGRCVERMSFNGSMN